MNRAKAGRQDAALELRFGPLDMAQVQLHSLVPETIFDELSRKIAAAPNFLQHVAVCLDVSALEVPPSPGQLRAMTETVRRAGMMPAGLLSSAGATPELARQADLPLLTPFRSTSKPAPAPPAASPEQTPPAPGPVTPHAMPALIHAHTVRSGQRVYARQRDLVVIATVSAGAELMADGCVHVYGQLRGRVMAGVHGDTSARVFCQRFNPELVSIAGVFRLFETVPAELAGRPVQAWLDGDDLRFMRMGDA